MDSQWVLPQKFWCYKKSFQLLLATKQLFKSLFLDYQICIKCIFRLYSFQHPKIYNDSQFYIEILPTLLSVQPSDLILKSYDVSQTCMNKTCWLCQQIFQNSFVRSMAKEIVSQIEAKLYTSYKQFKLNVRIPNIVMLRNVILARYVYFQQQQLNSSAEILTTYYNILVYPYEANKVLDPKIILKWILANQLNNTTNLTSTADDHPDNLVISIEIQHSDTDAESSVMNHFRGYLGLQKKKEKAKGRKQCLDLGQNQKHTQEYRCNSHNLNKVLNLKQNQFIQILKKIPSNQDFWKLVNGTEETNVSGACNMTHKIILYTKNVYLCGKYIKFSRYLSQTPWLVNGKKLTEGSLQEQIQDRIYPIFYPKKPKNQIEIKFHSGGREDIDVRMLKGGRPFVLEFVNPIKSIKAITTQQVLELVAPHDRKEVQRLFDIWLSEQKDSNEQQFHSWRIVKLLEIVINYKSPLVQVLQLQQTTDSFISVELKAAQTQKIKHYLCYIHSPQEITQQDKIKLQNLKDIPLQQLTPLRVLHRRTLLVRDKMIHRLGMHLVSRRSAILEVWASAGTYIKEFVHGDLGRTTPNVGSLLGKEVDILQLDVGSLKEGDWQPGDQELMKMEHFEWMD